MTANPRIDEILARARECGAALAGVVSVGAVVGAPSTVDQAPLRLPPEARSVLVLGLSHPAGQPELDWWGGPGGTPGNRTLGRIARVLKSWLAEELGVVAWILPYHVERGGLFLKDAAVLAGLGAIGVNNLVITPELGPRVRWKAMLLDLDLPERSVGSEPSIGTAAGAFEPCKGCDRPCVEACPRHALEDGRYHRKRCKLQMAKDEAEPAVVDPAGGEVSGSVVRYCRRCEQACPVGTVT